MDKLKNYLQEIHNSINDIHIEMDSHIKSLLLTRLHQFKLHQNTSEIAVRVFEDGDFLLTSKYPQDIKTHSIVFYLEDYALYFNKYRLDQIAIYPTIKFRIVKQNFYSSTLTLEGVYD